MDSKDTSSNNAAESMPSKDKVNDTASAVKSFKKKIAIAIVLVLVVMVAGVFIMPAALLYSGDNDRGFSAVEERVNNGFVQSVIKTFKYPVAKVRSDKITYSDFIANVDQAEKVAQQFAEDPLYAAQVPELPSRDELADGELQRLIEVSVLEQEIERFGIEVSSADVDEAYQINVLGPAEAQGQEAEVAKNIRRDLRLERTGVQRQCCTRGSDAAKIAGIFTRQ